MSQVFKTTHKVTFREADPAQIMFFGNIYGWAHDAFEEFVVGIGFGWKAYFHRRDVHIPIRHSSADYKAPFFPGEVYDVEVTIGTMSAHSYSSHYRFLKAGKLHAEVKLVHAFIDPATKEKAKMPADLIAAFQPYQRGDLQNG